MIIKKVLKGLSNIDNYIENGKWDFGPAPFIVDMEDVTKKNDNFRTALWTGENLQLTLMSIPINGEIGFESHPNLDQFIRVEEGEGLVLMGDRKDNMSIQEKIGTDYAFIIPAGTWHNLINTGQRPIKLYSIYAPPQHPHGTIHKTKEDAEQQKDLHHSEDQKEPDLIEPVIGAQAARLDKNLTLENMLNYAMQDENLARERYRVSMEKFHKTTPFANILRSEERRIEQLLPLFLKYDVMIPIDNAKNYVKTPSTVRECVQQSIEEERKNISMYDRFIKNNIPRDVKVVFIMLKNGSHNHLRALQRVYYK